MDRRAALKKLAAGGAIAMGGSMVLSTNNVAFAASGPVAGGIPLEGEPLPVSLPPFSNSSGVLTITDVTQPVYSGVGVQTSHAWRINGYTLQRGSSATGLELRSGGQVVQASGQPTCTTGCGGSYFAGTGTADVRPLGPNGKGMKFKGGDPYDIGMMVTWTVPGVQTVTAEYRITGTIGGGSSSAMVPGSYRVTEP
jgi:hypothetical protein